MQNIYHVSTNAPTTTILLTNLKYICYTTALLTKKPLKMLSKYSTLISFYEFFWAVLERLVFIRKRF